MYYTRDLKLCRYAEVPNVDHGDGTFSEDWSAHREAFTAALAAVTGFERTDAFTFRGEVLSFHNATLIEPGCNPGDISTFEVNGRRVQLRYVPSDRLDVPPEPGPIKTVQVLMPYGWPGAAGDVGVLQLSFSGWSFVAYPDPTLRRAPELDIVPGEASDPGHHPDVLGWRCEARPGGFRAPVGFLPGAGGRFVQDRTTAVTLRVPHEFVEICESVDLTPEKLLRGFIGDLSGIHNFIAEPRADEYGSNGSDERDMADQWFDRAYGMRRHEADMRKWREEQAREQREEAELREEERNEELAELFNEFEEQGLGGHEEFVALIRSALSTKPDQEPGNAS